MSKFDILRSSADKRFGSDQNEKAIASRAIDLLEDWTRERNFSGCENLSRKEKAQKKRECAAYIKAGLYKAREEEYGFLGALLTAVAFQILVQIIVKWIMNKFFDE